MVLKVKAVEKKVKRLESYSILKKSENFFCFRSLGNLLASEVIVHDRLGIDTEGVEH